MQKTLMGLKIALGLTVILGGLFPTQVAACTAAVIQRDNQVIMAKSFDWFTGEGFVVVNQKGVKKTAMLAGFEPERLPTWISRYGSVTLFWTGIGLPTGGMNQMGLSVTGLLFKPAEYPEPDAQPLISPSQWKQYVLDTCANVAQAVETLKHLTVLTTTKYRQQIMLADKGGDAALVQFMEGKAQVYRGASLPHPVTINDLPYPDGLAALNDANNDNRFCTAARHVSQIQAGQNSLPGEAFNLLHKVRVGRYTRWQVVHNLSERVISLQTDQQKHIWHLDLKQLDFSCGGPLRLVDINAPLKGNAAGALRDFEQKNYDSYINGLRLRLRVPAESLELIRTYPGKLSCSKRALKTWHRIQMVK